MLVSLYLCTACVATAATFDLPQANDALIGEIAKIRTQYEDTLIGIARRYNLGFREIKIANPKVDPWLPRENTTVVLPTQYLLPDAPRKGIVVNVAEMRLYYFPEPKAGERAKVVTYPISIGRGNWRTPLGITEVVKKVRDPLWYPPLSIRREHEEHGEPLESVVPPGEENPLGQFALRLGLPSYLIHGTNKPSGIGMQSTHGCLRLYPEDIEFLYHDVPLNTQVRIVNQLYKLGWLKDELFLQAYPLLDEADSAIEQSRDFTPLIKQLVRASGNQIRFSVDWRRVMQIASDPRGIPESVRLRTADREVLVDPAVSAIDQ
jgi:L,D-transpeptidase ErfK/SrfK